LETSSHTLDKTPLHILNSLILFRSIFKAILDKVLHRVKSKLTKIKKNRLQAYRLIFF